MKTELLDGVEGLVGTVDSGSVEFLEAQYVCGEFFFPTMLISPNVGTEKVTSCIHSGIRCFHPYVMKRKET